MNLLFITRELPPLGGGTGQVAWNLAEEMARQGHTIHIITMHFGDLAQQEQRGNVTIFRVPCGRRKQDSSEFREMLRFLIKATPLAKKIVGESNCQIINAFALIPDGLMAVLAAKATGAFTVLRSCGTDVPGYDPHRLWLAHIFARPLWHWTLNRAGAVVAPSRQHTALIGKLRPDQEIHVIANGIKPDRFLPKGKDSSFLICSRLIKRKNFDLFLRALQHVAEPQTVHVVGAGPMLENLRQIAATMPHHNIVFHGWLDNGSPQWHALYETCRYFVLPSSNESFGISLLEAQLAGMVVLASRIPVFEEILRDNAIYFDTLDVKSMADTLNRVVAGDFGETNKLVERGRKRVQETYSWQAIARRYLSLYDKLAGKNA